MLRRFGILAATIPALRARRISAAEVLKHDRRDFTAAHGLLRHTLSRYGTTPAADWQFETNGYGRPSIISAQAGTPPLSFNLSHTHGLVACAAAVGVDVGVDVERIDRAAAGCEIADRYLAPSEVAMLNASNGNEYATRFVELWTLKEAYLKALGLGLSCPLHSFAFAFEGDSGLAFHAPRHPSLRLVFCLGGARARIPAEHSRPVRCLQPASNRHARRRWSFGHADPTRLSCFFCTHLSHATR